MDFWDRLKNQIKDRNLTQERVARKLKIPIGTFKNWLLRRTYPDAQEIVEIAKLLDTTVEHLVTGTDRTGYSENERRIIDGYRQLSKYDQEHITVIIEAWVKKFKLETTFIRKELK
jgi:transcriptional regulator with XRE-family HTH domain